MSRSAKTFIKFMIASEWNNRKETAVRKMTKIRTENDYEDFYTNLLKFE